VQLGISDRTVQGHLAHIFAKMQAASRTKRSCAPSLSAGSLRTPRASPSKTNEQSIAPILAARLTLQVLVMIILPLTIVLTAVAVGSIAIHQQAMRASLPQDAQQAPSRPSWS